MKKSVMLLWFVDIRTQMLFPSCPSCNSDEIELWDNELMTAPEVHILTQSGLYNCPSIANQPYGIRQGPTMKHFPLREC